MTSIKDRIKFFQKNKETNPVQPNPANRIVLYMFKQSLTNQSNQNQNNIVTQPTLSKIINPVSNTGQYKYSVENKINAKSN